MKKVLLILVLLFPSSVIAKDMINDSSVVEVSLACGYINELDIIQINGWKFEPANTKNKVIYYTYIPNSDSFDRKEHFYKTSISKITTYTSKKMTSTFALNIIRRNNLDVSYYGQDSLLYKGEEDCTIYEFKRTMGLSEHYFLEDFKEKLIQNAKEKNLL